MSVIRNLMSKENGEIMAIIYYVRDGPLPGTTPTDGRDIMLNEVEVIVLKKDMRCEYCGTTPPEFNRDQPSLYPERVVIEVEEQDRPGNLFNPCSRGSVEPHDFCSEGENSYRMRLHSAM